MERKPFEIGSRGRGFKGKSMVREVLSIHRPNRYSSRVTKEQIITLGVMVGFAVVFPLFWCFVIWVVSRVGGWASLARSFAASSEPQGIRYTWRSMRISPAANYNGCLNIVLSPGGIYMVPSKIFSFGHEPLLLPWDCVEQVREQRFFGRRLCVSLSPKGKRMILMLPATAEEALRHYSEKRFLMQ